jgi:hypothetical protein
MKSITLIAEDRVGLLPDISYILGKAGIGIESLSVDVVGKNVIIALTVKDPRRALEILQGSGYRAVDLDSIVIKLPNKPGELNRIADTLSNEGVDIENLSTLSLDNNSGVFALRVNKPRKAVRLLSNFLINKDGIGSNASCIF